MLIGSLDASTRALELEPKSPSAAYNRALALDLLGLDQQALSGWKAFLALETSSDFADIARSRTRALSEQLTLRLPPDTAPAESLATFARHFPGRAREFAFNRLLGAWGDSVIAGRSEAAIRLRVGASVIAQALATTSFDSSAFYAVAAIARCTTPRCSIEELARTHSQFALAQQLAGKNDYAAADRIYRDLLAHPLATSLMGWISLGHATALTYVDPTHPLEASAAAQRTLTGIDPRREPLLAARLLWIKGLVPLRLGQTDSGVVQMRRARALFERAGDREFAAGTIGVTGEALLRDAAPAAGYLELRRSLILLRRYPKSVWRHNSLLVLARAALRDGFPLAARAIEDEDLLTAAHGMSAVLLVEARLQRSRIGAAIGALSFDSAMAEGRRTIASIPDSNARRALIHEMMVSEAAHLAHTNPDSAARLADSASAFFAARRQPSKLIPAMTVSATAAIAKGDLQVGRARLATAAAAFREVALSSARPDRASSALLAARDAFDELTSLAVRRGTVGEALSIVEQKRRSLRPWTFRDIGTANPTRGIVVSYALVGDTLLTWVLRGADTAFFRSTTRRDALRSAIGVARTSLRLHAPESVARRQLGILYDQLIRPVESAMAGAGLVTFVADDAIADLPFAALWNESRREYLLDRYTIALAPSIPTNEPAERSSGGGALFIAGVGTDLNRADAWAALPGAKGEVSAGSSEYPTRTVLGEDQATSEALIARLPLSAVVHFAGHAVLDNRNFERSYLALKPRGITALQISQLDLRSVRLVVLAACETATRESDGGGGLMGFADAFLSAGAQGVIGSLWPVDDASTQRLMTAFHRIYSRSRDPTSALRDAQLLERARGLPPAEWAAFQYTRR